MNSKKINNNDNKKVNSYHLNLSNKSSEKQNIKKKI